MIDHEVQNRMYFVMEEQLMLTIRMNVMMIKIKNLLNLNMFENYY